MCLLGKYLKYQASDNPWSAPSPYPLPLSLSLLPGFGLKILMEER